MDAEAGMLCNSSAKPLTIRKDWSVKNGKAGNKSNIILLPRSSSLKFALLSVTHICPGQFPPQMPEMLLYRNLWWLLALGYPVEYRFNLSLESSSPWQLLLLCWGRSGGRWMWGPKSDTLHDSKKPGTEAEMSDEHPLVLPQQGFRLKTRGKELRNQCGETSCIFVKRAYSRVLRMRLSIIFSFCKYTDSEHCR